MSAGFPRRNGSNCVTIIIEGRKEMRGRGGAVGGDLDLILSSIVSFAVRGPLRLQTEYGCMMVYGCMLSQLTQLRMVRLVMCWMVVVTGYCVWRESRGGGKAVYSAVHR